MKDAVSREFDALRKEVELRDKAVYLHYEARIDNLERRVTRDIEADQRQIDALRAELNRAIGGNTDRIAALERGEAGSTASDLTRKEESSRIDTWKLAILGSAVTIVVTTAVFLANYLTSH